MGPLLGPGGLNPKESAGKPLSAHFQPLPLTAAPDTDNLPRPSAGLGLSTRFVPQIRSTALTPYARLGYDDRMSMELSNIGEGPTSERAAV